MGVSELLKLIGEKAPGLGEKVSRGGLASLDLLAQNPEIIPNIEKLREQEEPELFTHVFGIPTPFMQLGTYLGVEGWKGLALDVIADPTNFIGGLGSLSAKAARGGRIARGMIGAGKLSKAKSLAISTAEHLAETAKGLGDVSEAEKAAESFFHTPMAADVVREIAFKNAAASHKTSALMALVKRSAQLDTFGHQRLQDVLSLAETDRDAVELIDKLQRLRSTEEVVETGSKEAGFNRFRAYRPGKDKTFRYSTGAQRAAEIAEPAVSGRVPEFSIGEAIRPGQAADTQRNPLLQHLPGRLELEGVRNKILKDGLEAGRSHLQELIDKRKDLSGLLSSFAEAGSIKESLSIAKQIDKLEPNRSYQVLFGKEGRARWKSYFEQQAKEGMVKPLARTAEQQIAAGQRNLITVSIPFIPGSERVIATGAPILEAGLGVARAIKGSKIGKALTGTKRGAFVGAGAAAGLKAGAFERQAAFDSVQDLSDQFFRSYAGGGLGTPEQVDDIFKQYQAMREHSTGLAATWGDEVRSALGGNDDLVRLAMDNPDDYFRTIHDDLGRVDFYGHGFDKGITRFPKDRLKAKYRDQFDDLRINLMQVLESTHIRANKMLVANGMLGEAVENYIPRLVKKVNKPDEWDAFLSKLSRREGVKSSSHFKKRTIESLGDAFELEKKGVVELEHDFGKIEAHWMDEVLKTAQQKRLYERLNKARVPLENTEDALPLMANKSSKAFEKHPNEYVKSINPYIVRAYRAGGGTAKDTVLLHKKYAKDLEVVFGGQPLTALAGTPFEQRVPDALLKVNAVTKRAVLGADVVSYGWFTERAGGTLGREWLSSPIAQTRMGAYHRARATDMWDTAVKAGLRGTPIEQDTDVYLHALDTVANWADKAKIPLMGRGIRGWRAFAAGVEQPAWMYYHPSLKMQAFSNLYEKALYDPRFAKIPMQEIAQGVAGHVNNAFSGLNWERMWLGTAGQKWLRLMMIAPDWTMSTIRLGADLFANQTARIPFLGRDMVAPTVRAAYARDYAVRAGIFTFGLLELANLATSSDPIHFLKTGQLNGHYMSDNEPDHRTQLQLPVREDGKALYWLPQKQWQDFASLANVFGGGDPVKFFANRMGLLPNTFNTVVTGRDSFGYPIVSTKDGFVHNLARRLGWMAETSILPSYAQTALGFGAAKARPMRGALEFGLSVRTGREQQRPENVEEPQEVINLQQEPAPPEDPIPPEFEASLAQELQENPTYAQALNMHLQKQQQHNVSGLKHRVMAGRR